MHIFDFRWDQDSKLPYFEIIKSGKLEKKFLEFNTKFSISVTRAIPHCTGVLVDKKYKPCPHKNSGQKKCELCKKAEDYFPCQLCNGFNCSRLCEGFENCICNTEHMLYLALFDKNLVKVGVSGTTRGKTRQFEQGSHFTRVFAKGMSGKMARRMETTIAKLGFPDKVPAAKKKNILFPDISVTAGQKILEEKFEIAKDQIISLMPEMKKYILEDSQENFWDMRDFYKNFPEEVQKKFPLPVHVLSLAESESVAGDLVMVKGPFLVLNTGTELAVLLSKDFVGRDVSFEECEVGITKNGGFQGGLF